jgi:hypothetical protein
MQASVSNLHTARFTIYCEERLRDGKMLVSERLVKLNVKPLQVYFYSIRPDPGMELLWTSGEKMLINPGGFPYITLKIDHESKVARKDSHHSVEDMGFRYLAGLINYYHQSLGDRVFDAASVRDTVIWQSRSCIHMIIDFKNFKTVSYTVRKGENLSTIAGSLRVNDYMILSLNPSIDDLYDVKAGQQILVPNFYASRIEFYIDRVTGLPVRQLIYDQKGLYEKYEFRNLMVNPPFSPAEFTPGYKDYHF